MKTVCKIAFGNIREKPRRTLFTALCILLVSAVIAALCATVGSVFAASVGTEEQKAMTDFAVGFLLLVVTVSCLTVSSALDVCFSGRVKLLGMLSSVGMSRKKRALLVLTEAGVYILISVLPGVLLGTCLTAFFYDDAADFLSALVGETVGGFVFCAEWVLFAFLFGAFAVLFAAVLPMRRASRITVLDALRGRERIEISLRQGFVANLTEQIFGRLGRLAGQNYENNKRRYRAVSFALTGGTVFFFLFWCVYRYGNDGIPELERPFWEAFVSSTLWLGGVLLLIFLFCACGCFATAVNARRSEFAALLSLGLSRATLAKMLCIESIYLFFYAAFYGLIASLITDGLLYTMLIATGYDEPFIYPFELYFVFLALYALVGVAFSLYTVLRLRRLNLCDAMRHTD